jgi:hypothetical protein
MGLDLTPKTMSCPIACTELEEKVDDARFWHSNNPDMIEFMTGVSTDEPNEFAACCNDCDENERLANFCESCRGGEGCDFTSPSTPTRTGAFAGTGTGAFAAATVAGDTPGGETTATAGQYTSSDTTGDITVTRGGSRLTVNGEEIEGGGGGGTLVVTQEPQDNTGAIVAAVVVLLIIIIIGVIIYIRTQLDSTNSGPAPVAPPAYAPPVNLSSAFENDSPSQLFTVTGPP